MQWKAKMKYGKGETWQTERPNQNPYRKGRKTPERTKKWKM